MPTHLFRKLAHLASLRGLTAAAALVATIPSAHAGIQGMNLSPVGPRTEPSTQFAYWNLFSQTLHTAGSPNLYTFHGTSDPSSTLTGLSLSQNTPHLIQTENSIGVAQGAGLLLENAPSTSVNGPDAEIYYASTRAQNWTLTATASVAVTELVFQIKTANLPGDQAIIETLFKPTLAGYGAATYVSHAATGGPTLGTFAGSNIIYRWRGLSIPANTPLTITFSMAGGPSGAFTRKPVDFVSLDVSSVPSGGTFTVDSPVFVGENFTANFANWADSEGPLNYSVSEVIADAETTVVAPGTNSAPTFALPVGTHTLRGRISDTNGFTATPADVTVVVLPTDKAGPVVKFTAPTINTVSSPFVLSGTVKEDVALKSFTVTLNGTPLTLDAALAFVPNGLVNWTVSGVTPENGANTIVVEAVDYKNRVSRVTKTVNYINDRPNLAGIYNALLVSSGTPDNDKTGLLTLTVANSGSFTGKVTIGGVGISISGVIKNNGAARFKPTLGTTFDLIDKTEFDSHLGVLALSVANPAGVSGTISTAATSGTTLATFAAQKAPYTTVNTVAAALLTQPTKGVYAVSFPSKTQTPSQDADKYPQGDGFASLTLLNNGNISFSGYLADGTKYTGSTKLRADGSAPFYTQLYRKGGAMAGELIFSDAANTDAFGANFLWLRPAQPRARYYPLGWPTGVRVDVSGTKHTPPSSLDFGQGTADPTIGNASLVFTDGGLTSTITQPVSVDPSSGAAGKVKLIPANTTAYKLSVTASTGVFSGTIATPNGTETFRGILLNKVANQGGFGYFLSTPALSYGASGQSGGVSLDPDGPVLPE